MNHLLDPTALTVNVQISSMDIPTLAEIREMTKQQKNKHIRAPMNNGGEIGDSKYGYITATNRCYIQRKNKDEKRTEPGAPNPHQIVPGSKMNKALIEDNTFKFVDKYGEKGA